MHDTKQALQRVQGVIRAAMQSGAQPERPESITPELIAVAKTVPAAACLPLLEEGHRSFGENKVQEALHKWPSLREQFPDICLHMIGPLQTNKAAQAVQFFDVVHTLDRPKLAHKLASAMQAGPSVRLKQCLIQVNTGSEPQKAGVLVNDLAPLLALSRDVLGLPVCGLMCIPPVDSDPVAHFVLLKRLARQAGLPQLSMGMSSDYQHAVAVGATMLRVGTALFGPRQARKLTNPEEVESDASHPPDRLIAP
ncbi:MAG: YggS family pyridoxal phosphate-dependent enzyme [Pseudomonadota bacterium]